MRSMSLVAGAVLVIGVMSAVSARADQGNGNQPTQAQEREQESEQLYFYEDAPLST